MFTAASSSGNTEAITKSVDSSGGGSNSAKSVKTVAENDPYEFMSGSSKEPTPDKVTDKSDKSDSSKRAEEKKDSAASGSSVAAPASDNSTGSSSTEKRTSATAAGKEDEEDEVKRKKQRKNEEAVAAGMTLSFLFANSVLLLL